MSETDESLILKSQPLAPRELNEKAGETSSPVTHLSALGVVFQRWAELCEAAANQEVTPGFQWFMKGAAQAHKLDAARIRGVLKPGVLKNPPKEIPMASAYEALINAFTAMATGQVKESENSGE